MGQVEVWSGLDRFDTGEKKVGKKRSILVEEKKMCIGHEQRISAVEASARSAHKRLDELISLNTSVNNLAISTATMAEQLKTLTESSEKMDEKLSALELKPGKRWEAIAMQIIQLLVAGVIGFLLSQLL